MPYLAKAQNIHEMDAEAVSGGFFTVSTLVDSVAKAIENRLLEDSSRFSRGIGKVAVVCGAGNNGADGYAVAARLIRIGIEVSVVSVFPPSSPEALKRFDELKRGGHPVYSAENDAAESKSCILGADTVIDAIFGVGYDPEREYDHFFLRAVCWINDSSARKISIDMPSGISSDDAGFAETDNGYPVAVKADETITLGISKPGLESAPGTFFAGRITVEDIGMPQSALDKPEYSAYLCDEKLLSVIPRRRLDSNKGSFGKLLMYCASRYMTGAGILAAEGALSGGVGLVNCLAQDEVRRVLQMRLTEPIYTPLEDTMLGEIDVSAAERTLDGILQSQTAVLIGCGIGQQKSAKKLCEYLIENSSCPIVLDADGLNLTADNKELYKKHGSRMVITPHPGEMSRLVGTDVETVQKHRIAIAEMFAGEFGCTVILKGFRTVVASPEGLYINKTGNPGMAKAGMGDLLAGLVSSFVAQGIEPSAAGALAVYAHGLAGDLAASEIGELSMKASDLVPRLGRILQSRGI